MNSSFGPLSANNQNINGKPRQQHTSIGNQYTNSSSNRIRESSSGALVGKNIAGLGGIIGKSQTNILNEELAVANQLGIDPNKRFQTHNHVTSDQTYNPQTAHSV